MALEQWQLSTYQAAAMAMCNQLGEDPRESTLMPAPFPLHEVPRWVLYAAKMAEHDVMVRCMRSSGFAV